MSSVALAMLSAFCVVRGLADAVREETEPRAAETTSAGTALGLFVGGLAEAQVCAMKPKTTTKITKQKGEAGKPTE